jgi:hypothetical protein
MGPEVICIYRCGRFLAVDGELHSRVIRTLRSLAATGEPVRDPKQGQRSTKPTIHMTRAEPYSLVYDEIWNRVRALASAVVVYGRLHLPSQVTSTRMSPCADFRWRFVELSLSVIVLVSLRQLAVEEAMAPAFSRVPIRDRERCFFILYAEASVTGAACQSMARRPKVAKQKRYLTLS